VKIVLGWHNKNSKFKSKKLFMIVENNPERPRF
jgi:hypothetical protein